MAASSLVLSVLVQRTGGSDTNTLYGPKEIESIGQNPGKFGDFTATLLPNQGSRVGLAQVGNIDFSTDVMAVTIVNEGFSTLTVGTDFGLIGGPPTSQVTPLFSIPPGMLLHIPCTSDTYFLYVNTPDPTNEGRCRIIVEALPAIS